jgi:hypothetical protein
VFCFCASTVIYPPCIVPNPTRVLKFEAQFCKFPGKQPKWSICFSEFAVQGFVQAPVPEFLNTVSELKILLSES